MGASAPIKFALWGHSIWLHTACASGRFCPAPIREDIFLRPWSVCFTLHERCLNCGSIHRYHHLMNIIQSHLDAHGLNLISLAWLSQFESSQFSHFSGFFTCCHCLLIQHNSNSFIFCNFSSSHGEAILSAKSVSICCPYITAKPFSLLNPGY